MKKSVKKTIIIFLILILSIFLSIFSLFKISKTTSFAVGELKKMEKNLTEKNKNKLLKKATKLEKNWQENSNWLRVCLKREPLEKIDIEFLKLKTNIKNFNKNKIQKNLKIISHNLKQIEKDSQPFLFNVF